MTDRRSHAAGGATRPSLRNRSRAAGTRAHGVAAKLRLRSAQGREQAQATVQRITGELADLAEWAVSDAEKLLVNAHRALRRAKVKADALAAAGPKDAVAGRRRGRLRRRVNDLTELLDVTRRIATHREGPAHDPLDQPVWAVQLGRNQCQVPGTSSRGTAAPTRLNSSTGRQYRAAPAAVRVARQCAARHG